MTQSTVVEDVSKPKIKESDVLLLLLLILMFQGLLRPANGAAISVIVPYSPTPVADEDLDGYPETGAWDDANSYTVDLENAQDPPYGNATIYFKHNGTDIYIRIDGKIDVPWTSDTGDHFWLALQINPAGVIGHHKAEQDLIIFGDTSYAGVTYPLIPIDTHGKSKPPTKDDSQDAFGLARYNGTSAPYNFTAEWRRKLDTGDVNDVTLIADGTTTYRFYVTTDSNGGGSSGGSIDHSGTTTDNTMKLEPVPVPEFPFGITIITVIAPLIPILYIWRLRKGMKNK